MVVAVVVVMMLLLLMMMMPMMTVVSKLPLSSRYSGKKGQDLVCVGIVPSGCGMSTGPEDGSVAGEGVEENCLDGVVHHSHTQCCTVGVVRM